MKRRGAGDGEIPEKLLEYRAEDWAAEEDAPDRAWSRARREWSRRNARTLADLNALYPPDLAGPPDSDPRIEQRLMVALHPTIAEEAGQ